jgi:hypothetical protein
MYPFSTGLQHLLPGEPTAEALHREEYYNESHADKAETEATVDEPALAHNAKLLRAQVFARASRFFAYRA